MMAHGQGFAPHATMDIRSEIPVYTHGTGMLCSTEESRKISGGPHSAEGTKTRMALTSLFETWQARGLNPLVECRRVLSHATAS